MNQTFSPDKYRGKIDNYRNQLLAIRAKILEDIRTLLSKSGTESINVMPYLMENCITSYTFYATDKDGFAVGYKLDTIKIEDGTVWLSYDNGDGYCSEEELDDLTVNEALYVLDMLQEIFEYACKNNKRILKEGEDFDDFEDETP